MSTVSAYKGFLAGMTCRGFQYKVGEEYKVNGNVSLCVNGFHAVTVPFDVWSYYAPQFSVYARVELDEVLSQKSPDTKIVGGVIRILNTLSLQEMIAAQAAMNGEDARPLATVEPHGHAATIGGNCAVAVVGDGSHAGTVGGKSPAIAAYDLSHAVTTGKRSPAVTTGSHSSSITAGDHSHAIAAGECACAESKGRRAHAVVTGDSSVAETAGIEANAVGVGTHCVVHTNSAESHACVTGRYSTAGAKGKNSIAMAIGSEGWARAGEGGAICLAAIGDDGKILAIRASLVGENGICAGTYYRLGADGEFVAARWQETGE